MERTSSWLLLPILFLLLVLGIASGSLNSTKTKENIQVFFIPHTHDDVGWLKTIDEYYEQEVKTIYNTVVEELDKRADRKFIIVEMAFFSRWWGEASEAQRNLVYKYVEQGKVEFVLGGWCMNDDADPTYSASINQLAEGHRFIFNTFGVLPKYGWHIDPFGLSAYYPTLFSKMGFNGHVINRIHYQKKNDWKFTQNLEFVWRGSKTLGSETEMLTHVLSSHYSFPGGFDFERDAPINDANIALRASNLVFDLKQRATWYRSKNVLVPGGDDFKWQNARVQYENWDKLIDYVNARSDEFGVNIRYSTLHEYFEALHNEPIEWPVYTEDFFPYADNAESYWTGFFTTHSQLKGYIRSRAALLRATELYGIASVVTPTPSGRRGDPAQIQPLRWATAEAQHHDGVTGTSKIKVIDMYFEHLDDGSVEATELLLESVATLLEKSQGAPTLFDLPTPVDNLQPGQFAPIVVANTLGWNAKTVHEFVTTKPNTAILNSAGERVRSQVVPYPFSEDGITRYQVFFEVDIPPAGYRTYFATLSNEVKVTQGKEVDTPFIENSILRINVTYNSDRVILEITNKRDGKGVHLYEYLLEYTSYTGVGQKSGAYIFRPTGEAQSLGATSKFTFYDGDLVQVVYNEVDATHVQLIRLYDLPGSPIEDLFEIQYGIGPLKLDREAIVRFSTSILNSVLYSDNNGVEMHQRPAASGLIQANYYPMVSQAYITDGDVQFGVNSERTEGVASLAAGEIEVMLHRRCSYDDGRGMGEALNDDTVVYPTLRLSFGSHLSLEKSRPNSNIRFQHRPRNFYANYTTSLATWAANHRSEFSFLKKALPDNIHLLAFKTVTESAWKRATVRLQHLYEKDTHPEMAIPVDVVLEDIFNAPYTVSEELELSGLAPMAKMEKLRWKSEVPDDSADRFWSHLKRGVEAEEETSVVVGPMQIKTFEFTF